jgi:outer membrane protein, multidrug efflux system
MTDTPTKRMTGVDQRMPRAGAPLPFARRALALALAVAAVTLAACSSTPTAPPALDLPAGNAALDPAPLERWWTAFGDPQLDAYVDAALTHNLDLAAAMARIETARAQVTLAQADLYPSANIGVGAARSRVTERSANPLPPGYGATTSDFSVSLDAAWEVDLWGKYRTATQAAREDLLATRYAREAVRSMVVADVARTWFQLLAVDAELAILEDTTRSREQTVGLQQQRQAAGVTGEYDLAQAQAELAAVQADIAGAQRAQASLRTALAVLTGASPRETFAPAPPRPASLSGDAAASGGLASLTGAGPIPEGLPSNLLERRPDIRQAERLLAGASLRIDRARADYFPSLTLTGSLGHASGALRDLASGPALAWGLAANLLQPVFGLRAIEANVEAASARRAEAVIAYRQTVQSAFREVHDALVANATSRDALAAQARRRAQLARAVALADARYRAGYSPYLEVLDAQRQLLQAQTQEVLAARDVRVAGVDLAKALGGGWDYRTALSAR